MVQESNTNDSLKVTGVPAATTEIPEFSRGTKSQIQETMAQKGLQIRGYYLVKAIVGHKFRGDWRFLVQWEGFSLAEATWELPKSFVVEKGVVHFLWGGSVKRWVYKE